MKKLISAVIVILMEIQPASVCVAQEMNDVIYMSAEGDDSENGTIENPCKTLKRAAEIAEEKLENGADSVYIKIHSGRYIAEETAVLPSKTICEAFGDGEVIFTGAKKLAKEGFKSVEDTNILSRLSMPAAENLLEYELYEDGFEFSPTDSFMPYLYVDGEEQTLGRYPNGGYLTAAKAEGNSIFNAETERAKAWENSKDAYVCGSLDSTYFWRIKKVKNISDGKIELSGNIRKNSEWYITNLLEEIDVAKEYFVDRNTQKLYFYPSHDFSDAEIVCNDTNIINISNTENVTIRGIKFEKLGKTAISGKNCRGVTVENCEFSYIQGDFAIDIEGENCSVKNNAAYGCYGGFVHFEGGELKTLKAGNMLIENNRITYCGRKSFSNVIYSGNSNYGMLTSCGNTIRNNVIADCMTFSAIGGKGNNYLIENNEIYNNGWLIDDAGAIYYGKSNIQYGNVIRNNYIHDLNRNKSYCGIYSDDGFSGITVINNIVRNAQKGMIINYGMNCDILNNIFINTDMGIAGGSMMSRGGGSSLYTETYNALNKTVYKDAFKKAYPEMEKSLSRKPFWAPWNTKLVGNVQVGGAVRVISDRPWHLLDENIEDLSEKELDERNALTYNSGGYVGTVWKNGTRVDELKGYGASVTDEAENELNATETGNPAYEYDDAYFVSAQNQDYTPTSKLNPANSDLSGVDMSLVGTNDDMITQNSDSISLAYPNDVSVLYKEIPFVWDDCSGASKYRIIVSQNADLSEPEIDEEFVETSSDRCIIRNLQKDKIYYWQVCAYGIGKDNEFEVKSKIVKFRTIGEDENETLALRFLTELCEKKSAKIASGAMVCPSELTQSLNEEYENAKEALQTTISAEESRKIQEKLYGILKSVDTANGEGVEIIKCEASENTSQVFVEAQGFLPGSLISALVTNPGYSLLDATENINLERIQYIRTLSADVQGKISFDFDTIVRGNDMPGIYTLYLTDEKGNRYSESFAYGKIEIGEIIMTDKDGKQIDNISEEKEVYLSCDIVNRTEYEISPFVINAFYSGIKLIDVRSNNDISILPDEKKKVSWKIDLRDIANADEIKVIFVDSAFTIKPLTTARVIYSIK